MVKVYVRDWKVYAVKNGNPATNEDIMRVPRLWDKYNNLIWIYHYSGIYRQYLPGDVPTLTNKAYRYVLRCARDIKVDKKHLDIKWRERRSFFLQNSR